MTVTDLTDRLDSETVEARKANRLACVTAILGAARWAEHLARASGIDRIADNAYVGTRASLVQLGVTPEEVEAAEERVADLMGDFEVLP